MNEHFIKNIKIKNFKCFDKFEIEGFSRVNLITGKNNVGKTALMEACHVNASSKDIKTLSAALHSIKFRRENINILQDSNINNGQVFLEQASGIETASNISKSSFRVKEEDGIKKYFFKIFNNEFEINVNDFSFAAEFIENNEFIDNFGLSNYEILSNFSKVQTLDREPYLNKILGNFDKNIESFKNIDEKPQCKSNGQYLEITEFGDGVRHLVSIVVSLFKCQNGYLFIDEIDNGIHYSKLNELWTVLLKTSKELNVQVFATTHSKECIESYARVARKLEDEEVALIELGKKDNKIESIVFDYNGIMHHIEQQLEVRGW